MKKYIIAFFAAAFLLCAGGAVASTVEGNHADALKFEMAAAISFAIPVVATKSVAGESMGLVSKSYFTESLMDRPLTAAEKRLWDYLNTEVGNESKARIQTRALLQKGDLKIETYAESIMFTLPISQGGRRVLLDNSTSYFEGRIPKEFDRGTLPGGFVIAVSHIGIGYATDAAIVVPEGDTDYVTQPNSWPAAVRNADIYFSQNGFLVQKFRAKFAGTQAASTNNAVEGDGIEFQRPFILEDEKSNLIEIYSPNGQTYPATPANLFLEFKLYGACVRPKM